MKRAYAHSSKQEFTELLEKLLEEREYYPVYLVDRCCLVATTLGFSYRYIEGEGSTVKELNIGEGRILFSISYTGDYAKVITPGYRGLITNFLASYI